MSLIRVPESSQLCQKVPRTRSRDTIQGHDTIVSLNKSCRVPKWSKIGPNIWTRFVSLRDTIKGHDRDTIRDTKIVSCPLIVSLKSRDTIFLEFVSLRLSQGHDSGTRHDRVPDKSRPANLHNSIKLSLFQATIEKIIMYGSETWTLKSKQQHIHTYYEEYRTYNGHNTQH